MKIALLSRNSRLYSSQRLVEAARLRGHVVRVLDPSRCYLRIEPGHFAMHCKGKPLGAFDAVVPRIGATVSRYGTAVLRQFEMMGVYTPNPSDAVLRARDKLRCLQLLAQQGIGLPTTVVGDNPDDTADLLDMLGPAPHVVKLAEGSQGQGVVLAETLSGSRSVVEAFRGLYANFLVQEFVAEAKGADLRCFVVGGAVVAAMSRQAKPGEFRSNLHRGGTAQAVTLSAAETDTAIRAAAVVGLDIAGVDLIRSERGPLVLEVNSSPGLEGIEAATGVDVADAIVRLLERRVTGAETGAERAASTASSKVLRTQSDSPAKPRRSKVGAASAASRRGRRT